MKPRVKLVLKVLLYPLVIARRYIIKHYMIYLQTHDLKKLAGCIYRLNFGKRLNWKNPQNLSEKINWMKFNTDTTLWTELADKYKVRAYVEDKGLKELLVEIYGVWEHAEDIDFDLLPQSFVIKTNHACGTVLIVKDKSTLDIAKTRSLLNEWLTIEMGRETAEPHYIGIKPLIIAEQYLSSLSGDSIIDYKLFVVDGTTELVMVCSDRKIGVGANISLYDNNWNFCPERLGASHLNDCVPPIDKPDNFEKMKEYAQILSEGIPFVRVDFYDVNGKVYFGELTFTPKGGYCSTLSDAESLRIGQKVKLPQR